MIIDTSVILAILGDEPERCLFNETIAQASERRMSVASFVEASIVLTNRYGYDGVRDFEWFLIKASVDLTPVDAHQARIAHLAFKQYGKGRHPARLNFGDCFPYALAKAYDDVLLFKGNDFNQTDIKQALI